MYAGLAPYKDVHTAEVLFTIRVPHKVYGSSGLAPFPANYTDHMKTTGHPRVAAKFMAA